MNSLASANTQKNLILYFQVHQPKRLRTLRFFDIGASHNYFDDNLNRDIIQRIAVQSYLPTNALLLKLIRKNPQIKVCFSVSGVAMDQFELYAPEVLASFRALAETGSVEFLAETYYHSLACAIPGNEFELQVAKHQKHVLKHFGVLPTVFRNTELIYNDDLGVRIAALGFKGAIVDGVDRILGGRNGHQLFHHPHTDLKLLTRDYHLSDDISFRFSHNGTQLTAGKYHTWLSSIPAHENMITLAMDYETFGEHQKKESGIFRFMENLLTNVAKDSNFRFMVPSEAMAQPSAEVLTAPVYISWADQERDLSAWLGNDMQRDAFDSLLRMEQDVKNFHNKTLLQEWRALQTSDHFYYMSTKRGSDGEVHSYFSPYPSPYEAFINYMNVISDLSLRIKTEKAAALRSTADLVVQEEINLTV